MKLSIAKSELLESLTIVSKGMSSRSTLPILSGILLSVSGGDLTMQATDLEVSVRHKSPSLVDEEGTTVVPGKILTDIVRSLPDAAVTLETAEGSLVIKCQQSAFTVRTLNAEDFPKFPEISVEKSVSLSSKVVASMTRMVSRAVSRDETRAVLTGVLFIIDGASVRMVATDSYRLAMAEKLLESPAGENVEVVIPGRALDEVTKIASSSEEIRIGISENQVIFEFGETTFVTRRVEGNFPNYKALIPKETESVVEIPTEELLAATKRVSLLALHNTPLKLSVQAEDQTLSLSAASQDVGDASEDLMVKVEGKDIEIAFNHAFFIDGLNSIPSENTRLELQSSLKPGLLKSSEEEDFLYLLMPVRLG